jgi:hypothetical protein
MSSKENSLDKEKGKSAGVSVKAPSKDAKGN